MRRHVTHLLTAYVHRQLTRKERERVLLHVRLCAECQAALQYEESLARDLSTFMPLVGQPKRGQLARLWPAIWMELRTPPASLGRLLPSYGVIFGLILLCAFVASSLFGGPSHARAAPSPHVPADIRPTVTPIRTDEAVVVIPLPSETASILIIPIASPAPHALDDPFISAGN